MEGLANWPIANCKSKEDYWSFPQFLQDLTCDSSVPKTPEGGPRADSMKGESLNPKARVKQKLRESQGERGKGSVPSSPTLGQSSSGLTAKPLSEGRSVTLSRSPGLEATGQSFRIGSKTCPAQGVMNDKAHLSHRCHQHHEQLTWELNFIGPNLILCDYNTGFLVVTSAASGPLWAL